MIISRRQALIGSLTSLIAAPAIVRASSLMPVKVVAKPIPSQKWVTFYTSWSSIPYHALAGENLYVGDIVVAGQDGRAYRAPSWSILRRGQIAGVVSEIRD